MNSFSRVKNTLKQHLPLVGLLLFFLIYQFYSTAISFTPSDSALVGVTAINIIKGDRPVFTYGQNYMGTVEAYLGAALFYIFGQSGFVLQMSPLIFCFMFLLVLYWLSRGLLGEKPALLSLALMVFGPMYFQGFAHAPRAGYIETLFFGTAFLWLVYLIVWDRQKSRHILGKYFFLGLLAGLGFWTNILVISYLLTGVFFLVLNDKKIFLKKEFYLALAAFFLGSAPFWIYNIQHALSSFESMAGASGGLAFRPLLAKSENIFFRQMPRLFNLAFDGLLKYPALLIYYFLFFIYFYLLFSRRRILKKLLFQLNLEGSSGLEMILLLVPLSAGICIISHFGSFNVPRYLMPLYTAYPILLAAFAAANWKKYRWLLMLLLAVIAFYNTSSIWNQVSPERARENLVNENSGFVLIDFLKKNGIKEFYANQLIYYRLNFLSREEIIGSAFQLQRCPHFGLKVNSSRNPAFIFHKNNDSYFKAALQAAGGTFKKQEFKFNTKNPLYSDFIVYYDLKAPPLSYREILPAGFKVSAGSNSTDAVQIFDRRIDTAWKTAGLMAPGDFLLADFGQPINMAKVEILPEKLSLVRGIMGGFQILASSDGLSWQKVFEVEEIAAPLFWSGPHPFYLEENGRIAFVFPPVRARFLKIVQTKESQRIPWVVRELFLYRPAGSQPNPAWRTDELLKFFEGREPSLVLADYWLSSYINQATGGRIKTLKAQNEIFDEEGIKINENPRVLELTSGNVFIVKPDESEALEKVLLEISSDFQKQIISGWLVYSGLKLKSGSNRHYFWDGTHLLHF